MNSAPYLLPQYVASHVEHFELIILWSEVLEINSEVVQLGHRFAVETVRHKHKQETQKNSLFLQRISSVQTKDSENLPLFSII